MRKTEEDFFGTVKDILRLYGEQVTIKDIYEGVFAVYYDTLPADPEEIGIYQKEAYDCGRNVLELCCGNGRITAAFAEKGFRIDGVDLSADMLERLEQKKHRLPASAARRIRARNMDLFELEEEKQYDFILLPATTICLFSAEAGMDIRLFDKISRLLKPDGRFMFDMRVYSPGDGKISGALQADMKILDGKKALVLLQEELDYGRKRACGDFYLELEQGDGTVRRYAAVTEKAMVTEAEMEARIEQSRLRLIRKKRAGLWGSEIVYYTLGLRN